MFTWLTSFYNNHVERRLFPPAEETLVRCADHHRSKMERAGREVMDADAPVSVRVEAVESLGIMAYSGGYNGASVATEFIPAVVHLLYIQELTEDQTVVILQGLTNMCYCHVRNVHAAHSAGLNEMLEVRIMPAYPLSTKAKLWSCYLLNILCYKNIPMVETQAASSFTRSLEALEAEDWCCWPKNHARELLCLLGIWPPQTVTAATQCEGPKTRNSNDCAA